MGKRIQQTGVVLLMLLMTSTGSSVGAQSGLAGGDIRVAQEQRLEIVIQNSEFLLTERGGVQLGIPTVIILRNRDIIPHGFTSDILKGLPVTAESEGMTAYGNGVGGFYLNPDKTLVIRFTPERPGQYSFRCDLHPQMKGEFFMMKLGQA